MSLCIDALKRWWRSDPTTHGAALAYYALFSITPMFIVFVAVFGAVFGEQAVEERIAGAAQGFAGSNMGFVIELLFKHLSNPREGLIATVLSSIIIVIGSLTLFSQVQRSLEDIWFGREPHPRKKTYWRTKALAVGMIALLAVLFVASIIISTAIPFVESFAIKPSFSYIRPLIYLIDAIYTGASLGYIIFLFTYMYKYLPGGRVSWRAALVGGITGGVLFVIGRALLNIYITTSIFSSLYGTAGAIILVLLWFYYTAQIFFFGGALAYALDLRSKVREAM